MTTIRKVFSGVLVALVALGCETVVTERDDFSVSESEQRSYTETELEDLQERAKEYPKRPDYHYRMAGIYFQQQDFNESAACLQQAILLDPNRSQYHYHLGRVYLSMGELEKAESSFRRAVSLTQDARYSGPLAALSFVQARRGKLRDAVAGFERCLETDPNRPEYYYFLGALHDMLKEPDAAIRYFREYLDQGGMRYRNKAIFLLERMGVEVDRSALPDAAPGREELLTDDIEVPPDPANDS